MTGSSGYRESEANRAPHVACQDVRADLLAYRAQLLRFLRARGARDSAEDLLQDLWLKLDRLEAEGPIADPRAYLFRMADNLMYDRTRAVARRTQREHAWCEMGWLPPSQTASRCARKVEFEATEQKGRQP